MADIQDPAERLEALLESAEPNIRRAFLAAVAEMRGQLDMEELEALIASGRLVDAMERIMEVAEDLAEATNLVFLTAGQAAAEFLTGAGVARVRFDVSNAGAVQAMRDNRLSLIREYAEEQRRATQAALVEGIAQGLNPRDQARTFRDVVGLTERQAAAVMNYRRLLTGDESDRREALTRRLRDGRHDRTVQRSIREERPLTPAQIEQMVSRYAARYVKYRAEVIGRTEALRAVHEGNEEGYRQAIEAGRLDAARLVRAWDSSRDDRVRESHRLLHGVKRGWGETWPGKAGPLRYPGDPAAPAEEIVQCRCLLTTRIKPTMS